MCVYVCVGGRWECLYVWVGGCVCVRVWGWVGGWVYACVRGRCVYVCGVCRHVCLIAGLFVN